MNRRATAALLGAAGAMVVHRAFAAPLCHNAEPPPPIPAVRFDPVANGFEDPVHIAALPDGRLFIVEQAGRIWAIRDGQRQTRPFLDIRDRVKAGGERGLLSVAFHPDFEHTRRLFVDYTASRFLQLRTVIAEFQLAAGAEAVDPTTERILLTVEQPYPNHNGGQLAFGPDGKLYLGMGDGGAANDPHDNGQRLDTLLGKMLRVDADAAAPYAVPPDNPFVGRRGARGEIWALGLRNPWRFSFDAATGSLFTGDVGQNDREEIDVIEKGKNYGWRLTEGTICTPAVGRECRREGLEPPILDYGRAEGISVTGGFVYRGRAIADLCGVYLFADYGSGRVWGARIGSGSKVTDSRQLVNGGGHWSTFGEDAEHEILIADHSGGVIYRIIPWDREVPGENAKTGN